MAKPIEPTPPLRGEDAEQLLRELKDVCSPEEAERRIREADSFWEKNVRAPGWRKRLNA